MKQWFKQIESSLAMLIGCGVYKMWSMEGTINTLIVLNVIVVLCHTLSCLFLNISKRRQEAKIDHNMARYLAVKSAALVAAVDSSSFLSHNKFMASVTVWETYKGLLNIAYSFYRIAAPNEKTQAGLAFYTIAANAEKDHRMDQMYAQMKEYIDRNFPIPTRF
jgi:hypothetical protein